jgi:alpha-mannosidase
MWQLTISQRLRLLERRMLELSAWRVALEFPVPAWVLTQPNLEAREVRLGDGWGFSDGTHGYNTHKQGAVRFETTVTVPDSLAGFPVELELDFGGEGFVEITNSSGVVFRGGLNPFHKAFPLLEKARGGESFKVVVDVVPKGLFGSRNDAPGLARAHLVAPHLEIRGFVADLEALHQVCLALDSHEVVPLLLAAAEDVLTTLPWTSHASEYLSRLLHGTLGNSFERSILWSLPKIPELKPLEKVYLEGVNSAQEQLQVHVGKIKVLYPPQGSLALTGHAHIDLAWLWTISETRRKIRRTFATVLDLMNRYPDFKFNQSSAQAYAWLEQDDPQLFEQVKARVLEGRWETIGGMWVEPDGQMLNGESWVRQIIFGQQYFLEKFGRINTVAWLPDTFGFNPQLPQLLRLGGMNSFFTTKLRWNETTEFPHDLFTWEGLDGSKVLAHCFWNKFDSYNALLDPKSILETWRNFKGKSSAAWLKHNTAPQSLLSFGYGDGGGGPSREHLESYARLQNYPSMPKLEMTRVDDFYKALPTDLPVWKGEMYLELHRGTLTTQARIKKLHRALEHRLLETEMLWSLAWLEGETYPQAQLENLWKTLLLHQFHDILPGSSIREVYEDAHTALETALQDTITLQDSAPRKGALCDLLEHVLQDTAETNQIDSEVIALENGGYILQNLSITARINASGWLESIHETYRNIEYIAAPCTLTYQHDVPREWEAWDINPPNSQPIESQVEFIPSETGLRVIHRWRDSSFEQEFKLLHTGIEVKNKVFWQEKRIILRAEFPVAVHGQTAFFETAFGVLERPTRANTALEMAAFEVPAQRFVLLQEGMKNMVLLNDSKYGFAVRDNVIIMSLLRGTMYPDPTADLGEHEFTYALDYLGDQELTPFMPLETVADRGLSMNSPLLGALEVLARTDGLMCSAMYKSRTDQALILRFYELNNQHSTQVFKVGDFKAARVSVINFLEQEVQELEIVKGAVTFKMRGFEIITLKLWLVPLEPSN